MSTNDRDSGEQLEQESKKNAGNLKSKLGLTILISVLILIAGLLFYRNLKNKSKINELYQKAMQAEVLENFDEASKYFQEILKIKPLDAVAHFSLGNTLPQQGKYDEAIASYSSSLEINPKNLESYNNIGVALAEQEKYKEAIENYNKALKINPDSSKVYNNMAKSFYLRKEYQQALETLKKAVKLNPKDSQTYYSIGLILYAQGRYDQAIENYKKSLQLNSNEVLSYLGIGTALFAQGKYDETIECYRKCFSIDPNYIPAKANTAEAYLVTERFEQAFEMANELLKEKGLSISGKVGVRFTIIASLIFQGKDAEAREEFQRFTEYYYSVNQEYEREWNYKDIKEFINQNKILKENKRTLLLKLIDILESPKAEGDKKLTELEIWLKETKWGEK